MRRLLPLLLVLLGGTGTLARAGEAPPAAEAMRAAVRRFAADEQALRRFYAEPLSAFRLERLARFLDRWQAELDGGIGGIPIARFDVDAAIDHRLLTNHLARRRDALALQRTRNAQTVALLPFAKGVLALEAARRASQDVEPRQAAQTLRDLRAELVTARGQVEGRQGEQATRTSRVVAYRAAAALDRVGRLLASWFAYRDGYEPAFRWWVRKPFEALRKAMADYATYLRRIVAGVSGKPGDPAPLIGDPIGREALARALTREMIPYTPAQVLAIAHREFAWCAAEGRKAAAELGFRAEAGKDAWRAAVEHVKGLHRPPGRQDDLVAAQAREAIAFLRDRDLVTIPPLAAETWRLSMISAAGQKTLPFAVYNDQHMLVAYATEGMDHDTKLASMRGNNEHFTRIVTPHELIPGHHLQLFMAARQRAYRELFRTPFFVEGWALHWEMLLWDLGWARGPEDRVGMLFWRMHRCARIIVTLRFHLGLMTPAQMVDFLHERVGLERDGATGEVRRYIAGAYGPLYQAAYMLGGLQLRALYHELVGNGILSNRAFHDAVLRQGSIPLEMVRAALTRARPDPRGRTSWRFYGDVKAAPVEPGGEGVPCPR